MGKDIRTMNDLFKGKIAKEFQVILSACRIFLGTEEPSCLEEHLKQGLDWSRLVALANRHGVMPLLYYSMCQGSPHVIPKERLMQLRMLYMQNGAWNLKMTAELLRLMEIFETNGIEAVPFKGPLLGQAVYEDINLRTFVDLDILVQKEAVLRAKEVLLKEGYRPELLLTLRQEELFLKSECEYNFYNSIRKIRVEVHWRISPSSYCISLDIERIWQHVGTQILEGREVPALSSEDLLIFLCIHGARHNWADLKQIVDVARLIKLHKDSIDFECIVSDAHELHIERILLLSFLLAQSLFEIRPPEAINNLIKKHSDLQAFSSRLIRKLTVNSSGSSELVEEAYFWFYTRERTVDKLNCILRLGIEPTQIDLMQNSLPLKLYPLYYLMHPARLLFEYVIKKKVR